MAVQIDAPNDGPAGSLVGHAPGWPTTDLMVINDNNKAQPQHGRVVSSIRRHRRNGALFYGAQAALFPRDVQVRYDIAPKVARVVRVQEISVTGGHEDQPQIVREPHGGQVLTLAHMEPGENRWLGVTLTVMPETPLGLFLPWRGLSYIWNFYARGINAKVGGGLSLRKVENVRNTSREARPVLRASG